MSGERSASAKEIWPAHKAGEDAGACPEVPEGCKVRHYAPLNQSPYWRAELPAGASHLGRATKTKSYIHSEGIGGAKVESASARLTVVAWLWDWAESQSQQGSSAAASGSKGGKKRERA